MAALRRRRTDEENVSEPAEEAQATLDFGSSEETEEKTAETPEAQEPSAQESPAQEEHSEAAGTEEAGEEDSSESGRVVVKRRRVVRKTEETEGSAPSEERQNNNNNYRYQNNQNRNNNFNNRRAQGMRKPYGRNSYTPPSAEVAEMMAAEAAAAAEENANKPRLLINELTKESMPELRERAIQFGYTADDLAPMKKQDLIFVILKAHTEHGGIIFAEGSLEIGRAHV